MRFFNDDKRTVNKQRKVLCFAVLCSDLVLSINPDRSAKMDAVKSFNSELSSLYEVKPPISKAKMTALTRGAIKAIKFYKHVVQSVEKFILKCKPEYKVPGLYVIDSIVRQSRHQFGVEKDVFAPRFSKNLQQTFINLFKCPPEDKSKIIRVLNLWQKNHVFAPEVIQPLFDLADPNNPIHQQLQQQQQHSGTPGQQLNGGGLQAQSIKGSPALQRTPTKSQGQSTASEAPAANLNLTEPVLQQLQQLQRLLTKGAEARPEQVHFDKKLLDFDYGEDEDEVNPSPRQLPPSQSSNQAAPADTVSSLLTNPEVLRQLQTLQSTLASAVNPELMEAERMKKLQEMKLQEDEFDKHLAQTVPNLPFASECDFKLTQPPPTILGGLHFIPPQPEGAPHIGQSFDDGGAIYGIQNNVSNDVEVITLDHDDSDDDRYKRKRSRSRSRDRGRDKDTSSSSRRRRSRSRSRSRSRRHRSKSRDRKDRDKKEKETERDRERKKRGLPTIKKDNLSVCSTTLWVGHLSKLVHQDDLSNTFGEFGEIISIDLIVPRGCAFIVMNRRQDAARCLAKLKNYNLHGKAITLAWAPGKGVKGKDFKDYWEGELGVSYIPWNKLKQDLDLEALEDGGMIDEDTMPEWMKRKVELMNRKGVPEHPPFLMTIGDASNQSATIDTSQPPPMPPTSLMQPPMMSMVNPFQLNNRFLGMIPNLQLGVPPPNMAPPPSMLPNLSLGLGGSPFQGPPSFLSATASLPPPSAQEAANKTDAKLRNLSESLMNLAGQPLTMPRQLPPSIHMDDNMDVEMEDAAAMGNPMSLPPPNIPLSEQLQNSLNAQFNRDENRFSPGRRRDDRGRRRSRSRERDRRDRSRDRRDRDRGDFGRRDRPRERGNRWGKDDRRGPGRRDDSYERRDNRRVGEPDTVIRDKSDREKTLNDRLKEMAGIKFDDRPAEGVDSNKSPIRVPDDNLRFEPPTIDSLANQETALPDRPSMTNPEQSLGNEMALEFGGIPPPPHDRNMPPMMEQLPPPPMPPMDEQRFRPFDDRYNDFDDIDHHLRRFDGDEGGMPMGRPFVPDFDEMPPHFAPDGGPPFADFGPDGPYDQFGPPRFRDEGPPFDDDGYGPPPDMLMDEGPPGYFGYDGPPDRFGRGGRRPLRGRRGHDFYREDFMPPPLMEDDFGPLIRDDFGPRGPPRGRGRGGGFFNRGGPRGAVPPPFREGFPSEFDHFRGGPRGRAFGGRGRGGGFKAGRGGRPDFFEGPPFDEGPPGEEAEGGRRKARQSRWTSNPDEEQQESQMPLEQQDDDGESVGPPPVAEKTEIQDGGATPLRDEINDEVCRPALEIEAQSQEGASGQVEEQRAQMMGENNGDCNQPENGTVPEIAAE